MTTIDGAQMSGSGTIVRYAVALAALLARPVRVINARQRRREPGLRPQHVTSVRACAELCGATVEGVEIGSRTFDFFPGSHIAGGSFEWDIGTAGSGTMLALSVLPVACFAAAPVKARITGGLFQDFAPSPFHMHHVLAPILRSMGADVSLEVRRPGYVPGGGGIIEMNVVPDGQGLAPVVLNTVGEVSDVHGIALSSHLAQRHVSERMASTCEGRIRAAGLACAIDRVDVSAVHAGACLAIWAKGNTGGWFGTDRAGKFGRSSEQSGESVATTFLEDVRSGATVDRHLADQLVLFCALARGRSSYIVPCASAHLESNLWLAAQFGARVAVDARSVEIDGIGLTQAQRVRLGKGQPQSLDSTIALDLVDLAQRRVRDAMVPWSQTVKADASVSPQSLADLALASGHTRLPILRSGEVIGMLHTKELLTFLAAGERDWRTLVRPAVTVGPEDALLGVLRLLQTRRSHMGIVVDREGVAVGIVTLEDILEEVLGDLYDEDDDRAVERLLAARGKLTETVMQPARR